MRIAVDYLRIWMLSLIPWGFVSCLYGSEPVRVMTFNIRFANPDDGPNAWPERREWVAEIFRNQRVDAGGLQEVLKSQLDDLRERLPEYEFYGVGRDDGREGGEYGPVFWRRERFTLRDQGEFWLSERPDEPGRCDWGAACARMVTWVKLTDRRNNSTWVLYNTHFDHVSADARERSARLLLERVPPPTEGRSIVMGDFNCRAESPPLQILAGDKDATLQDTLPLAGERRFGPDSTWNGFTTEIVPRQRIDLVLVSDGWKVLEHRTIDEQRNGRFPSDHLPVVVTVAAE